MSQESSRGRIIFFLNDFFAGLIDESQVKQFIKDIIYQNPYVNLDGLVNIEFIDGLDANTHALYNASTNTILINNKLIIKLLDNPNFKDLFDLVQTIGHELKHKQQYYYRKKLDVTGLNNLKLEDSTKKVVESLGKCQIEPIEVASILNFLKNILPLDLKKQIDNMTVKERQDFIFNVSFGSYLDSEYERDARIGGIDFAQIIFNELKNDNYLDSSIKAKIKNSTTLANKKLNSQNVEDKNIRDFFFFKKIIETIPITQLTNLEDAINTTLQIKPDEPATATTIGLEHCYKILLDKLAPQELYNILNFAVKSNYPILLDSITHVFKRKSANQSYDILRTDFINQLTNDKIYKNENIDGENFMNTITYLSTTDEITTLITNLYSSSNPRNNYYAMELFQWQKYIAKSRDTTESFINFSIAKLNEKITMLKTTFFQYNNESLVSKVKLLKEYANNISSILTEANFEQSQLLKDLMVTLDSIVAQSTAIKKPSNVKPRK